MKRFILLSILSAFALTATAQSTSNNENITISGATSDTIHKAQPMSADEFNEFSGSYELSNGNSLALFTRGLKKYAALHGEAWHELDATSSHSFVAKDKQLQMTIWRHENGDVSGELLMVVTPEHVAKGDTDVHVAKVAFHKTQE